jgi:hypothetical protein
MSELFEDEEDMALVAEEDIVATEDVIQCTTFDARRRLESLLDEKRLHNELDDFLDYE